MGRSRSRSRSRERRRDRSRSRSRERDAGAGVYGDLSAMQALSALQQQQAMQRQLMTQQLLLQQQAVMAAPIVPKITLPAAVAAVAGVVAAATGAVGDRRQREIYVGNLAIGQVTAEMLRELFNTVLSGMLHDPEANPPVIESKLDSSGRFAFVEVRTIELADAAMQLDKLELCGRQMNVGRPKGYHEYMASIQSQQKLSAAQAFAAQLSGGATNCVLLENLMDAGAMRDENERKDLYDDVFTEAIRCGALTGIAIPAPPPGIGDGEGCRVYVKYQSQDDATKCKQMMDGRTIDDRTIKATYTTDMDFSRAVGGEWITTTGLALF